MSPEQYAELLNYIQKNNGWKDSYDRENLGEVPFIKYVSSHYDTRDCTIYSITIQDGERGSKTFSINNGLDYNNVINYLNGKESAYILNE